MMGDTNMDDFDYYPEPYENDLEEWGNREAWEDAIAEREYDSCFDDYTEIDGDFEPEDSYLDSAYEDRTEFYY